MKSDMSMKSIVQGWIRAAMVCLAVCACLFTPVLTATSDKIATAEETLDATGESNSILDEVEAIIDAARKARSTHDQAVSSTSDMKSVADELEAAKTALSESERANSDVIAANESGKSVSIIAPSDSGSSNVIEDDGTPLSQTPSRKSVSLFAPAS